MLHKLAEIVWKLLPWIFIAAVLLGGFSFMAGDEDANRPFKT